jgi:hypothetical protein
LFFSLEAPAARNTFLLSVVCALEFSVGAASEHNPMALSIGGRERLARCNLDP